MEDFIIFQEFNMGNFIRFPGSSKHLKLLKQAECNIYEYAQLAADEVSWVTIDSFAKCMITCC